MTPVRDTRRGPEDQRVWGAGHQSAVAQELGPLAASGGAELPGAAGGLGQGLEADRAAAGSGDWCQTFKQPSDVVDLLLGGEVGSVAMAAGEESGKHAAQPGEVAGAGAEQVKEVFDGPGGEDAGAGEVEAEGAAPVSVGGVEEEVAGELLAGLRGRGRWQTGRPGARACAAGGPCRGSR